MSTKISGGGSRKYGRNKIDCLVYKNSNRRAHNKVRRLKKHLIHHDGDQIAREALTRYAR